MINTNSFVPYMPCAIIARVLKEQRSGMKRLIMTKVKKLKKYDKIACLVSVLLIFLCVFGFFSVWYEAKRSRDIFIAHHIQELAAIFKKIDEQCHIIGFDHTRTYIDFLNVNSFEGSEVGAMNLTYPDKWQGAYLKDNFTMQGRVYEIVTIKSGSFIMPGHGVVLSSGLIMGEDIVIDDNTDMDRMLGQGGKLNFKGKPLALKISTQEERPSVDVSARILSNE